MNLNKLYTFEFLTYCEKHGFFLMRKNCKTKMQNWLGITHSQLDALIDQCLAKGFITLAEHKPPYRIEITLIGREIISKGLERGQ